MANSNKDEFIKQAGILAIAGIIVRIIGLLYRSPLTAIIGDEGNGYYSTAYTIYTIILLISSYSIPAAISKVIAVRLARGEYRNAHKIFMCAFLYVIAVGGVGSACCFFFAESLVGANSAIVLKVFAPTIFLSGILGVLRGYFQAHRSMVQTSFSQIIEQILNACVSIGAAYLLMQLVADQDQTTKAIYGAVGSAMGTGAGVMIALLFMTMVYGVNRKMFQRRRERDKTNDILAYGTIFKIIFFMITPVVLSTCIYNLSGASNLKIYYGIYENIKGYAEAEATTMYGLFSGKAMQLANIPIALASAMSAAMIPSIARSYELKNRKETNQKVASAIKTTMLISIPAMAGLMVLAEPIVMLLYPQRATVGIVAGLLRALAITVIFYGLSTLSNAVLQGIGRVNVPVINAAIALVIQSITLVIILMYTDLNLYGLVIATVVYSSLMCMLNGYAMRKYLKYRQEIIRTFILPGYAAIWMGVVAFLIFEGMSFFVRFLYGNMEMEIAGIHNIICLLPAIALSACVYGILIIKVKAVTESELKNMPKGKVLVKMAKKCHLY